MSTSRQIGDVKTTDAKDGKSYEIRYFVLDADLSTYIPTIGSVPSWVSDTYAVVESYDKEYLGPGCWILSITAKAKNFDGAGGWDDENLEKNVKINFPMSELYLPMQWWGVHKASDWEVTNLVKNIYNTACNKDDYIYRNATYSYVGDPDYTKSPFVESGLTLSTNISSKK